MNPHYRASITSDISSANSRSEIGSWALSIELNDCISPVFVGFWGFSRLSNKKFWKRVSFDFMDTITIKPNRTSWYHYWLRFSESFVNLPFCRKPNYRFGRSNWRCLLTRRLVSLDYLVTKGINSNWLLDRHWFWFCHLDGYYLIILGAADIHCMSWFSLPDWNYYWFAFVFVWRYSWSCFHFW